MPEAEGLETTRTHELTSNAEHIDTQVARFGSPRVIRSILIFTVVGVILYAAATLATDYRNVIGALAAFPGGTLVLVLVLAIVGWLLRGLRFHYYLAQAGERVPLGYSVSVFLAGFALTGTPGKMGEAIKGVFLKQDHGVALTRVVGILVVERLMDLWGVLLLGSLSVLMFSGWIAIFLLCAGLVIAGGVFLCMERIYRPVLEALAGISFLKWVSERILGILLTGRDLMTPRIFVVGLVVSTIAWGMESLSLYLILEAMHLPSTLLQANFVYCFGQIVGALSMLPGGIGGTEAGMSGLLAVMGISYTQGLPAIILLRICTLWFAILVGIGFMIIMTARGTRARSNP